MIVIPAYMIPTRKPNTVGADVSVMPAWGDGHDRPHDPTLDRSIINHGVLIELVDEPVSAHPWELSR